MKWLSIYNYNFFNLDNKESRYLELEYKYGLLPEEFIEIEIRTFILFKQLRYRLFRDTVLMEFQILIPEYYLSLQTGKTEELEVKGQVLKSQLSKFRLLCQGSSAKSEHTVLRLYFH